MLVILWAILALLAALALVAIAARSARSVMPPVELAPGETLPSTPAQRLVRRGLVAGVIVGAAAFGLVAWAGPITYVDDDPTRLAVTGLLLASLVILAAPAMIAGAWGARGVTRLDERDRAILATASNGQAAAMLVVLVAWVIALNETYRGAPGIPDTYLNLIFWSCVLTAMAAWNLGVLLGYRRS